MENKCLVCGAIIPEGRQVCPTCKKGGKHEISKKLTDEEIVKALEHCYHSRSCEYCYHNDENGSGEIVCRSRLMGKTLDLIHRLQSENGKQVRIRCDMQRKFDDLQTLCTEQKAEIERLKEKSISHYRDSWKNKFFKAQEEVERLTEELKYYRGELQ
jgi:hypothetical protein